MAPEDNDGSGAANAAGGAGAAAAAGAAGGAGAAAAAAAGAGAGDDNLTIFDVAGDGDPKPGEDGKPVMPDWLPGEQFWDKDGGKVRVEDMAKSWKDLRDKVAKGPAAKDPPPASEADYKLPEIEGLPPGMVGGEKDTLWPAIRAAAHKAGISQTQLEAVARPYLQELAKGVQRMQEETDPVKVRETQRAELRAELAKLGPSGETQVRDLRNWVDGLQTRGILTEDEAYHLKALGTAEGVRAMMKLREMTGDQAIPTDIISDEAGTARDARRMMTEGYAKGDQALIDKGRKLAAALDKQGKLLPAER